MNRSRMLQGVLSAPDKLLLDVYSGAVGAYSLRYLSSSFVGNNVILVRRSSDDAEQGFAPDEITDGSLTSFCGSGDGFIKILYDQSGNGFDVSQTIALDQPKIVNGGALITLNGNPAIQFNNISQHHKLTTAPIESISGNLAHSMFAVLSIIDTTGDYYGAFNIGYGTSGTRVTSLLGLLNNNNYWFGGDDLVAPTGSNVVLNGIKLLSKTFDGSMLSAFEDGSSITPISTTFNLGNDKNVISIGRYSGGLNVVDSKISEAVCYFSDQSGNRTGIEGNMNNYYGVY